MIKRNDGYGRVSLSLLAGLQLVTFSACSSSTSDPSNPDAIFSDPVDATTLREALITGSSVTDTDQYWLCTINGDNRQIEYRLFADSSGTEIDQSNPTVSSGFSWQVLSATAMNTTVVANGMTINFTNIEFSGRNAMSLVVGELTLACSRKGELPPAPTSTPAPQSGANSLTYGGTTYPLTHGFVETFPRRITPDNTHAYADFYVADDSYTSSTLTLPLSGPLTTWSAFDATVELSARLFSPGGYDYQSAEFNHAPDLSILDNPSSADTYIYINGSVGIDANGDGEILQVDSEYTDIISGTIKIDRLEGDDTRMSFNVTLADGVQVAGSFTGRFLEFSNL